MRPLCVTNGGPFQSRSPGSSLPRHVLLTILSIDCGMSQVHSEMWCRWLYTICVLCVCFVLLTIRQTLAVRHKQVEAKGEDVAGGDHDERYFVRSRLSAG